MRRNPVHSKLTLSSALTVATIACSSLALAAPPPASPPPAPAAATTTEVTAAAPAADDVVTLRDGALLRGRVAELTPGRSVTIVLLVGGSRSVTWADIASASGPSFPNGLPGTAPAGTAAVRVEGVRPAEPVAPPEDPPDTTDFLTARPGTVAVVVVAEEASQYVAVALGVLTPQNTNTPTRIPRRELCHTPCTLHLRPGPKFPMVTGGPGAVTTYQQLTVPEHGGRVRLRNGSVPLHGVGIFMAATGSLAAIAGFVLLIGGSYGASYGSPNALTVLAAGAIGLGGGLLLAIPGFSVMNRFNGGADVVSAATRTPRPRFIGAAVPANGGMMMSAGLVF